LPAICVGFPDPLEQRFEVLMVVGEQAEPLGDGEGVIIHREREIAAVVAVVAGVPEPLVAGPPLGDRRVSLPLADGVGEVDVADPYDADAGYLDQRDGGSGRVDDYLPVAGSRQRLGVQFVVCEQPVVVVLAPAMMAATSWCDDVAIIKSRRHRDRVGRAGYPPGRFAVRIKRQAGVRAGHTSATTSAAVHRDQLLCA
jgi:hypothetical protein